jgi:hypothetical protein
MREKGMIGSTGNRKIWAAVIIVVAAAVALSMALADDAEAGKFVTKTKTFSSTQVISFPGPGSGPANPYPSTIPVSFKPGSQVADVDLTLHDFESKNPDDVAVMVAHGQRNQGVMADAGGSHDLFDINIEFDDESPIRASDNNPIGAPGFGITTVVAPARYGADWPDPAPSALSVFDKMNPNGNWELFVVDDGFGSDPATIGHWSLTIKAKVPR